MLKQSTTSPSNPITQTQPDPEQQMRLAMLAGYNLAHPAEQELIAIAADPITEIKGDLSNSWDLLYKPVAPRSVVTLLGFGLQQNIYSASRVVFRNCTLSLTNGPAQPLQSDFELLLELAKQLSPQALKELVQHARTLKRQSGHIIKPDKKERLKITRIRQA